MNKRWEMILNLVIWDLRRQTRLHRLRPRIIQNSKSKLLASIENGQMRKKKEWRYTRFEYKNNCNEKQWPKQQPQNTMKRKRSHTVLKIIYIIHYHHQRSQQFNIASFVLFVHLNIWKSFSFQETIHAQCAPIVIAK